MKRIPVVGSPKRIIDGLPIEEWDFSLCPAGREVHCFYYEYAREAPWIVDEYRLSKRCRHKVKPGWNFGFDDIGNWHFWSFGNSEKHDDWGIYFQAPPGFPETPYLKTSHQIIELPRQSVVGNPPFLEGEEWKKQGFDDTGHWIKIRVNWEHSDKTIATDFQRWLKRNRKEPARERRGNPANRRFMADLNALGAYRLMVKGRMTAHQAHAYTKECKGHPLYAKIPDWYEAKAKAISVLEDYFRYSQVSIAGEVLKGEPCMTCPGRRDCSQRDYLDWAAIDKWFAGFRDSAI